MSKNVIRWYIEQALEDILERDIKDMKLEIDLVLKFPQHNHEILLRALKLAVVDVG